MTDDMIRSKAQFNIALIYHENAKEERVKEIKKLRANASRRIGDLKYILDQVHTATGEGDLYDALSGMRNGLQFWGAVLGDLERAHALECERENPFMVPPVPAYELEGEPDVEDGAEMDCDEDDGMPF